MTAKKQQSVEEETGQRCPSGETEPQPNTWCGLERDLHHTRVSSVRIGVSGQSVTLYHQRCGDRMSGIICYVSLGNMYFTHRGSSQEWKVATRSQ